MNKRIAASLAAALAVSALAPALADVGKKGGGAATLSPADGIKWADVPGFPGVQMAAVRGNPAKGASHILMKLPGGFSAPLHHHTPDHYVAVVSGTLVLTVDGKETKLPGGSYFSFVGKKKHVTKCEAGADCVLFVDARGKWDVLVDQAKPAPKK